LNKVVESPDTVIDALGFLSPNNVRRIKGEELDQFLLELGVKKKAI
jgi:hypothetical protein